MRTMHAAGPRMDIVIPALRAGESFASAGSSGGVAVGCLAHDVQSYAECVMEVLDMPEERRLEVAAAARQRALLFSQEQFRSGWLAAIAPVLPVDVARPT